jgi:tRNA 5-methylaminomethyl-2-thiouridine biosynthesis bifunctional protein
VRCTVPDRLPVVGAVDATALPGLLVSTGMGARGMTLAVLCGELLAAQLQGEPLPVPLKQARALAPQRLLKAGHSRIAP